MGCRNRITSMLAEYLEYLQPIGNIKNDGSPANKFITQYSSWHVLLSAVLENRIEMMIIVPDKHMCSKHICNEHICRFKVDCKTYKQFIRDVFIIYKITTIILLDDETDKAKIIKEIMNKKNCKYQGIKLKKEIKIKEIKRKEGIKVVHLPVEADKYLVWIYDKIQIIKNIGNIENIGNIGNILVYVADKRDGQILASMIEKIESIVGLIVSECSDLNSLMKNKNNKVCGIVWDESHAWLFKWIFKPVAFIDGGLTSVSSCGEFARVRITKSIADAYLQMAPTVYRMYKRDVFVNTLNDNLIRHPVAVQYVQSYDWYILALLVCNVNSLKYDKYNIKKLEQLCLVKKNNKADEQPVSLLRRGAYVYNSGLDIEIGTFLINSAVYGCFSEAVRAVHLVFNTRVSSKIIRRIKGMLSRDGLIVQKENVKIKSWIDVLVNTLHYRIAHREANNYRMVSTNKKIIANSKAEFILVTVLKRNVAAKFIAVDKEIIKAECGTNLSDDKRSKILDDEIIEYKYKDEVQNQLNIANIRYKKHTNKRLSEIFEQIED